MCYGPGDIIETSCPAESSEAAFTMVLQFSLAATEHQFSFIQSGSMDGMEPRAIHEQEVMPNGQMSTLLNMLQTQGN